MVSFKDEVIATVATVGSATGSHIRHVSNQKRSIPSRRYFMEYLTLGLPLKIVFQPTITL